MPWHRSFLTDFVFVFQPHETKYATESAMVQAKASQVSDVGSIPIARSRNPVDAVGFTGFHPQERPYKIPRFGRRWTRVPLALDILDAAIGSLCSHLFGAFSSKWISSERAGGTAFCAVSDDRKQTIYAFVSWRVARQASGMTTTPAWRLVGKR